MRFHPASAVFDTRAQAKRAAADLRAAGAPGEGRGGARRGILNGGTLGAALAVLFRGGQSSTRP